MAFNKREREDYNKHREHVSREVGLDKNKYNALRRVSHGLHKTSEASANGEIEEKGYMKEVGKHFSKAEALRKKIHGKDAKKKMHYYHQTDPRGTALYASKERMNQMNYNSKGHPIY